jgi:hypothetical protein
VLTGTLTLAVLAGGAVAVATRDRQRATLLTPLNGAPYVAPPTTPTATTPTVSPDPTPDQDGTSVLTSPAPNTRQGLRSTPDPPKPAHYPLPTGCISYAHSCAYDGATGAVTGGAASLHTAITGPTSVRMSWTSANMYPDPAWAPITEFVARAYLLPYGPPGPRDPSRLVQVRLPVTTFSYTFTGLRPGGSYMFWIMELNSSGLGSGPASEDVRLPAPPPSPTPTPSSTPSATPEPTETPEATATPSETPTP